MTDNGRIDIGIDFSPTLTIGPFMLILIQRRFMIMITPSSYSVVMVLAMSYYRGSVLFVMMVIRQPRTSPSASSTLRVIC